MNNLGELLKGFKVAPVKEHSPSFPKPTPKPEKNKVVGDPTRKPVNKQAALLISPIRSWLSQPLPDEKLPTKELKEIEQLKNTLKTERNDHAVTRDELGNTRIRLSKATAMIQKLRQQIEQLKREGTEKDSIIKQLENIRL